MISSLAAYLNHIYLKYILALKIHRCSNLSGPVRQIALHNKFTEYLEFQQLQFRQKCEHFLNV